MATSGPTVTPVSISGTGGVTRGGPGDKRAGLSWGDCGAEYGTGCQCSRCAFAGPPLAVCPGQRPFGWVTPEMHWEVRGWWPGDAVQDGAPWQGLSRGCVGLCAAAKADGSAVCALLAECPRQFWGPDCKEMCSCHPNGQCEDVTGQCTCNPNRWGPKCENVCLCKHGKCDQKTGKCTCEPNWWGPQCSSSCYCSHNSQCDQQTGNCLCQPGWWGRGCNNQCSCNNSPCEQFTGRCQCRERTFGPRCDRYCQCYKGKCNQVDGTCTCEPGYRGKYCREPCPAGFYGQGCRRR